MSETKHSRGPWFVEYSSNGRKVWYVRNDTDVIAKVYNEHDANHIVELFNFRETASHVITKHRKSLEKLGHE